MSGDEALRTYLQATGVLLSLGYYFLSAIRTASGPHAWQPGPSEVFATSGCKSGVKARTGVGVSYLKLTPTAFAAGLACWILS